MPGSTPNLNNKQLTVASLLRLWFVFSFVFVLGILAGMALDGDNPLVSDDPYIEGFVMCIPALGLAFIYCLADSFRRLARWKHWIVASVLTIWCLTFGLGELVVNGEGDGILLAIAIGSLVAGVVAWLLCVLRVPTWMRAVVSAAGATSLLAYGCVAVRLMAR